MLTRKEGLSHMSMSLSASQVAAGNRITQALNMSQSVVQERVSQVGMVKKVSVTSNGTDTS